MYVSISARLLLLGVAIMSSLIVESGYCTLTRCPLDSWLCVRYLIDVHVQCRAENTDIMCAVSFGSGL